jgi:hypothetical protein
MVSLNTIARFIWGQLMSQSVPPNVLQELTL